jgi:hypothetical protein
LGDGNYPQGLTPDHSVAETDMLPLKPLGSPEDPLIGKAIELITSDPTNIQGVRGGRQAGGAANKVIYESRAILSRASEVVYVP